MKHKKLKWVKPSELPPENRKVIMEAVLHAIEKMEDDPETIIKLRQIFTPKSVRQTYVELPNHYETELVEAFDLFSVLDKAVITISVNTKTGEIVEYKQELYVNY